MASREISFSLPAAARQSSEYFEGRMAFSGDEPSSANPYSEGDRRRNWFLGWYDARIGSRLGHVFAKWKLDWPGV